MRTYQTIYQKGAANAGTRSDPKRVLAEMRKVIKADADPLPPQKPKEASS